jgi:hypothetical protein
MLAKRLTALSGIRHAYALPVGIEFIQSPNHIDTASLEVRETATFENGGSTPKIVLKNAKDSVGSDFIWIAVTQRARRSPMAGGSGASWC